MGPLGHIAAAIRGAKDKICVAKDAHSTPSTAQPAGRSARILLPMEPPLIQALRDCRAHILARWETLLRSERVNTALASPDLLVRLFDATIDTVFVELTLSSGSLDLAPISSWEKIRAKCPCRRNPLLAYYSTAEHVLLETLTKLEAVTHQKNVSAADELRSVIRLIALHEIESFCSVCQYRSDRPRSVTGSLAI